MTLEELIIEGKKYIHSTYVEMLLANLLELNSFELLLHLNEEVSTEIVDKFKRQVQAVKNNEPIQYVIGNVNFYGNIIDINPSVLIPRFETEELIQKTINLINNLFPEQVRIVDIGTGSGCIAITLKKELKCEIDAVDISKEALKVAEENIKKYNLDIHLYQGNLLEPLHNKYDVIISNPPYIAQNEEIMDIVKNNEPHTALYADDNGLYFYKEIIKNSKNYLNEKSMIAFEIGRTQGNDIKDFAQKYYPFAEIKIEKDLALNDRFLFIINN